VEIKTYNYHVTISPEKEWKSVAGAWTPDNRIFALIEEFQIPQETQNIEEKDKRRIICLDDLMRCPTDEEKFTWSNPGQLEELSREELLCYLKRTSVGDAYTGTI